VTCHRNRIFIAVGVSNWSAPQIDQDSSISTLDILAYLKDSYAAAHSVDSPCIHQVYV